MTIFHVNQAAGGSWDKPYADLQEILTSGKLKAGDEIWVARGTYLPTKGTDRTISFELKDKVKIYGGFAGTEERLDQRDLAANPTKLSGDLGTTGNSYHVLKGENLTEDTVLDGFTITGGNANGDDDDGYGGGLYCDKCNLKVHNLIFERNQAVSGGALYSKNGSPELVNLTFSDNSAERDGGAILTVNELVYSFDKHGVEDIKEYNSNPTLTKVTFSGNKAADRGGAIFSARDPQGPPDYPKLSDVTFSSNQASEGGAMYNLFSRPTLTNVIFAGNQAGSGGAMYSTFFDKGPMLNNVTFSGNKADQGGAIYSFFFLGGTSHLLNNVTFSGNKADQGGAIYNTSESSGSSATLTNVILWGNAASQGSEIWNAGVELTISYSIVKDWDWSSKTGSGIYNDNNSTLNDQGKNLNDDPHFFKPVEPDNAPTSEGDLRPLPNAPAIKAGKDDVDIGHYDTDGDGILGNPVSLPATSTYNKGDKVEVRVNNEWCEGVFVADMSQSSSQKPYKASYTDPFGGGGTKMLSKADIRPWTGRLMSPLAPHVEPAQVDLRALETAVITEVNEMRANPRVYAAKLGKLKRYYYKAKNGSWYLNMPDEGAIYLCNSDEKKSDHEKWLDETIGALKGESSQYTEPETTKILKTDGKLPKLEFNDALRRGADYFASDPGNVDGSKHEDSQGRGAQERAKLAGYNGGVNECIPAGEQTAYGIVAGLLIDWRVDSRGHRKNLMKSNTKAIGVACHYFPERQGEEAFVRTVIQCGY